MFSPFSRGAIHHIFGSSLSNEGPVLRERQLSPTKLLALFLLAFVLGLQSAFAVAQIQIPIEALSQPTPGATESYGQPIILNDLQQRISINNAIDLLEDLEQKHTIETVTTPAVQAEFKRLPKSVEGLGYRSGTVWVRITVQTSTALSEPQWLLQVTQPNLDSMILYRPEIALEPQRTVWLGSNETGDKQDFKSREIAYRVPVFRLNPTADAPKNYILKLTTTGSMSASLILWSPEAFHNHATAEYFWLGLYFGCFAVLALYNLSLFFAIHDRVYLIYFGLQITIAVFVGVLNGLSFQYLWPNWPAWASAAPAVLQAFVYVMILVFLIAYLSVKTTSPVLYKWLRIALFISLAWFFTTMVIPYRSLSYYGGHVVAAICMVSMISSAVLLTRRHIRPAYFYLASCICAVVGALIFLGTAYGITLLGEASSWGLQIGMLLDASILSLGLADRIATLRKDRDAAQDKTIAAIKAAEQQLEERVVERTQELQSANTKLQNAFMAQTEIEEQLRQQETAMRFAAHHDALTALPNRALLSDRLDQAILKAKRDLSKVAVMMIDLDNFKQVNDSLGHSAGDLLLTTVASRLQETVREHDTVARFGGDEFVVVLSGVTQAEDALPVAEKLLASLRPPIPIGQREMTTGGSIGIAIYPDHAQDAEFLIRAADKAMYSAKSSGRNCARLFKPAD